jgi:predicted nuclease with TOPRIM domain
MTDTPEDNTNRTMPFSPETTEEIFTKAGLNEMDALRKQNRLEADMYQLRERFMASRREVERLDRTNRALEASLRHVTAALNALLNERPEVEP